jgi:hypothetical protein
MKYLCAGFSMLKSLYQSNYKNVRVLTIRTYRSYPAGLNCISHPLELMGAQTGHILVIQ